MFSMTFAVNIHGAQRLNSQCFYMIFFHLVRSWEQIIFEVHMEYRNVKAKQHTLSLSPFMLPRGETLVILETSRIFL